MYAVAEPTLKPISIKQCHGQLEVPFLAVMRGGGHEQEVPRQGRKELPLLVAFGVLHFPAEEAGGQLVRLVTNHQVPAAVRRCELLLHVLIARQLVQTRNEEAVLKEPVSGASSFELVIGENLKGQLKAMEKLILPLLSKAPRARYKASLQRAQP